MEVVKVRGGGGYGKGGGSKGKGGGGCSNMSPNLPDLSCTFTHTVLPDSV